MSLIDEALKRAEVEAARRDGLRGGPYPWVPEHMPARRRKRAIVALFAVIVGVVAGGVLWLRRAPAQGPGSRASGQGETGIRNPGPGIAMETVEVAPPPLSAPREDKSSAHSASAKEPKSPAAAVRDEGRRKKGPTGSPSQDGAAQSRSTAPAAEGKQSGRGLANGKTFVGEVAVPDGGKIELEGIVYSESNPVALINGKVLPPGGVVEEFTIVSISSDRVELNGRGLTIFLALK